MWVLQDENLDLDSKSEDAEDECPTVKDKDPVTEDEGQPAGDKGPSMEVKILGLGGDEAVHEDLQDGMVYIDVPAYPPSAPLAQTPPSSRDGMVRSLGLGELSLALFKRSLEHKQERITVTFGALWRLILALEAWAGRVDTRMKDMSWAEYNDHRLVHDMLLQQTALHRELKEMRGRVTALEQERDRKEWVSVVMSADFVVTYSSIHSEARSWSIPSEDPYEEAAQ
nr:hypothetical protein [Tanacetum cinerariifolium]